MPYAGPAAPTQILAACRREFSGSCPTPAPRPYLDPRRLPARVLRLVPYAARRAHPKILAARRREFSGSCPTPRRAHPDPRRLPARVLRLVPYAGAAPASRSSPLAGESSQARALRPAPHPDPRRLPARVLRLVPTCARRAHSDPRRLPARVLRLVPYAARRGPLRSSPLAGESSQARALRLAVTTIAIRCSLANSPNRLEYEGLPDRRTFPRKLPVSRVVGYPREAAGRRIDLP